MEADSQSHMSLNPPLLMSSKADFMSVSSLPDFKSCTTSPSRLSAGAALSFRNRSPGLNSDHLFRLRSMSLEGENPSRSEIGFSAKNELLKG
jgi:hypothetical protein